MPIYADWWTTVVSVLGTDSQLVASKIMLRLLSVLIIKISVIFHALYDIGYGNQNEKFVGNNLLILRTKLEHWINKD